MLKLFIQDHGVYGMCMAIAYTESEAREFMRAYCSNYDKSVEVEVRDIIYGLTVYNLGDS